MLAQTIPPGAVVVINNDPEADDRESTTRIARGVQVVSMVANTGSAGGFGEALRLAYEHGLSWAWLLDDEAAVLEVVEAALRSFDPRGLTVWREAGTLGLARAAPMLTRAGKMMPLHHLILDRRVAPPWDD